MTKEIIRYFGRRPGAGGETRYYWQPPKSLRDVGWTMQRLLGTQRQAMDKAIGLNEELDAWRAGAVTAHGPLPAVLVQPRTIAFVIRAYKASRLWNDLRPRTQRAYGQNITVIEKWGGDLLVAAITPSTVETLYVALYKRTPSKAKAVITMLRIILQHAIKMDLVSINAAARAGIKGCKPSGRVWPREAVQLFIDAADAAGWHSVGTAVVLAHWFGQREGDVLALAAGAVTGGRLVLAQSKTGARVSIPETPEVRARIAAELARQDARAAAAKARGATLLPATTLLVCETTGQAWTEHYFRHVFADIRSALAAQHPTIDGQPVEKLWFMHLRHTAVTELSLAGCTPQQIAGITGHSLASVIQILARYLVTSSEMADVAAIKRVAYEAQRKLHTIVPKCEADGANG